MRTLGRIMQQAVNCKYFTSVVQSGLSVCKLMDQCPKSHRWWTCMGYATALAFCLRTFGVPAWHALVRIVH
eukprot:8207451-Lingulodinium_polyedra.AAC.1